MEHTVMPKNSGIFGIQTKYQTNAQLVQTFQGVFRFRIGILLVKGIIQQANDFARRDGDFHFPLEVFVSGIDKKLKPIVFFFPDSQVR